MTRRPIPEPTLPSCTEAIGGLRSWKEVALVIVGPIVYVVVGGWALAWVIYLFGPQLAWLGQMFMSLWPPGYQ